MMRVRQAVADHFAEVVQWSAPGAVSARTVGIAALAVAAPILVGAAAGRPEVGFTAGLGAMLLAGEGPAGGGGAAAERPRPGSAIYPAVLAVLVASLISAWSWTDLLMVALAGIAATVSGYSRPVGVAAIRFIVYLVLSVTLLESAGSHRADSALVFGLGALWNITVRLVLAGETTPPVAPARQATAAQRRAYFRRSLQRLDGWQFTLRLVAGLGIASALRLLFPAHHYTWIVLTATLLTQRQLEHVPIRITQRLAGTLLGVLLTWLILLTRLPIWGLALAISTLGTAALLVRSGSYLVYAILATPVILLAMDIGRPFEPSLLTDRLAATLIGAAIVIALNVWLDRLIGSPKGVASPPPAPQ